MASTSFLSSSRCPIELLSEIFLHCADYPILSVVDGQLAPLLLLRVCRRWNEVALATPRLWSDFHVAMHSPGWMKMVEQWVDRLETASTEERQNMLANQPEDDQDAQFLNFQFGAFQRWIERSKSAPLSCKVLPGDLTSPLRQDTYRQYLCVLIRNSWHWGNITLLALPSRLPESLSSDSPVSKLRTIALFPEGSIVATQEGPDPSLLKALQSARQLQEFSTKSYKSWTWTLPWAQLTRLSFSTVSVTTVDAELIFDVVSQCTALQSFSIQVTSPPSLPPVLRDIGQRALIHPAMQQLFVFANTGLVHSMLNRLNFNSLRSLEIAEANFLDEPPVAFPSILLSPFGTSSSTLERLHLQLCRIALDDVVEVIKPFHALSCLYTPHLDVPDNQNAPKFVESMTLRFDSDGRMISGQNPLLETLDASLSSAFFDLEDQFVDMIESRWRLPPSPVTTDGRPVPRLRQLRIASYFAVELKKKRPEAYERLRSFKDEGMMISRFGASKATW